MTEELIQDWSKLSKAESEMKKNTIGIKLSWSTIAALFRGQFGNILTNPMLSKPLKTYFDHSLKEMKPRKVHDIGSGHNVQKWDTLVLLDAIISLCAESDMKSIRRTVNQIEILYSVITEHFLSLSPGHELPLNPNDYSEIASIVDIENEWKDVVTFGEINGPKHRVVGYQTVLADLCSKVERECQCGFANLEDIIRGGVMNALVKYRVSHMLHTQPIYGPMQVTGSTVLPLLPLEATSTASTETPVPPKESANTPVASLLYWLTAYSPEGLETISHQTKLVKVSSDKIVINPKNSNSAVELPKLSGDKEVNMMSNSKTSRCNPKTISEVESNNTSSDPKTSSSEVESNSSSCDPKTCISEVESNSSGSDPKTSCSEVNSSSNPKNSNSVTSPSGQNSMIVSFIKNLTCPNNTTKIESSSSFSNSVSCVTICTNSGKRSNSTDSLISPNLISDQNDQIDITAANSMHYCKKQRVCDDLDLLYESAIGILQLHVLSN